MSADQWAVYGDRTKARKVHGTLRGVWGKEWCEEKGVVASPEAMMSALDIGILHWEVSIIACIEFNHRLLEELLEAQG
jgi:hypothetical protein